MHRDQPEIDEIVEEAKREIQDEMHRARVEAAKAEIYRRRGKSWLARLFPFTVSIKRTA